MIKNSKRFKDLTGKKFGKLMVVKRSENINNGIWWECLCDCGEIHNVISGCLASGNTKSCGKCRKNIWVKNDSEYSCIVTSKNNNKIIFYIDDVDYENLKKYTWRISDNGYIKTQINKKPIYIHRIIMEPSLKLDVDHINNNKLDNRRSNLRVCTRSENLRNKKVKSDNKSGYTGVFYSKKDSLWVSYVCMNNKTKYIGWYKDKEDAIKARKEAEKEYYGEYAYKEAK